MIKPNKEPLLYKVSLTEDEIYTLQLILGHVNAASDKECRSVMDKLDNLIGEIPWEEDHYEQVKFIKDENGSVAIYIEPH